MRLSNDLRGHASPDVRRACNEARVELDGVVVDYVIEADEETGAVRKYKQDADGLLVRESDSPYSDFVTEILRGKVEICLPKHIRIACEKALQ